MKHTPVETYQLRGREVLVKREDLYCPVTRASKMRGIERWVWSRPERILCAVDTWRSRNGLGLTVAGMEVGKRVIVYRPEDHRPDNEKLQMQIVERGGQLVVIPKHIRGFPMQHVLTYWAEEHARHFGSSVAFLPSAAKLVETVEEVEKEARQMFLRHRVRSIVVPVGTGTHLAGILRAVSAQHFISVIGVCGYKRKAGAVEKYVHLMGASLLELWLVDEKYSYSDRLSRLMMFPASEYYETKAWDWLERNIKELPDPVMFWNVGAV